MDVNEYDNRWALDMAVAMVPAPAPLIVNGIWQQHFSNYQRNLMNSMDSDAPSAIKLDCSIKWKSGKNHFTNETTVYCIFFSVFVPRILHFSFIFYVFRIDSTEKPTAKNIEWQLFMKITIELIVY